MEHLNRRARRAQLKKRSFIPGLSVIASAGLISGYIPYLRPASALVSTPCVLDFSVEIAEDRTVKINAGIGGTEVSDEISSALVTALGVAGECNGSSSVTLNFKTDLTEQVVYLAGDLTINVPADITAMYVDFADGLIFSGYKDGVPPGNGTYEYGVFFTSGNPTLENQKIVVSGLDLLYSDGVQVLDLDIVNFSETNISNTKYNSALYVHSQSSTDSVIISDSNFERNRGAGALYATNVESIEVSKSIFTDNVSQVGGAIYSKTLGPATNLTVTGSSFTSNSAENGNGGAIGGFYFSDVSIESSTFIQNFQTDTDTGSGGAIGIVGFESLQVRNSTFIGNQAQGLTESKSGGAIFADYTDLIDPSAQVSILQNTFIDNFSSGRNVSFYSEYQQFLNTNNDPADFDPNPVISRFTSEGASVHLYSNNTPSSNSFNVIGNVFVTNSSVLSQSSPPALMVGGAGVANLQSGQNNLREYATNYVYGYQNFGMFAYGYSATPLVAEFNISDDASLNTLSDTNRDDVVFTDLTFGSLATNSWGLKTRRIGEGSVADNFVSKQLLGDALWGLLPTSDQQGNTRGLSTMDAGAFEYNSVSGSGGGGGGGGGLTALVQSPTATLLSPIKFSSPRVTIKQRREIRALLAANPLTTKISCQPFVTAANVSSERRAAREKAQAVCKFIQKNYPQIFVRVEPLKVVKKSDPKNRRVQISLG